ncbi:hypothetical protein ACGFMK_26860 [Amycolatopsis sp. NPDC049252]
MTPAAYDRGFCPKAHPALTRWPAENLRFRERYVSSRQLPG